MILTFYFSLQIYPIESTADKVIFTVTVVSIVISFFAFIIAMNTYVSIDSVNRVTQMNGTVLENEDYVTSMTGLLTEFERLSEIVEASDGKVETDVAGYSTQGNEIISARVGTGDQVLLITGSIHGNEKSGGEALVEILEYLGTSDSAFAQSVREEVTIVAIPRYNVDGLEIPQRQNIFPWNEVISTYPHLEGAEPAWYYNERIGGFDLNRDFNANLNYEVEAEDLSGHTNDFGFFITEESQLLRDLYLELKDEFGHVEAYADLHHMGTPVMNKSGEDVTIAIDYPPLGPDDSTKYDNYPLLDQDKSKRYALAAALGVKEFSDKDEPGVA